MRQGKRVAAIFHLSTTTRAKQIESIVSRHCWNSFSHFIRFSLNWLKTCAKYFKMLQLVFILLFIFSSRNSHLLKLVWNSYVDLWQQNLSIVPTIFFTGAQFIFKASLCHFEEMFIESKKVELINRNNKILPILRNLPTYPPECCSPDSTTHSETTNPDRIFNQSDCIWRKKQYQIKFMKF